MRIDLFRSGSHTAMGGEEITFSEADLAATAAAYDPSVHEAPLVVGHPRHDLPAYGWVQGVHADGAQLSVDAGQVDPAFAELVEKGRFKKVSASFYPPNSRANPTPGVYHLRHVAFLGAQPPAIKGLQPVHFAAGDEEVVTIEFGDADTAWLAGDMGRALRSVRDWILGKFGQEEADKALPGWTVDSVQSDAARMQAQAAPTPAFGEGDPKPADEQDPTPDPAQEPPLEPEAASAAFAEREASIASREAALADRLAAARRTENAAALDAIVAEGKLAPGWRDQVANFLESQDADAAVAFAEGQAAETPRDFLLRLLKAGKPVIDFSEVAAPDTRQAPAGDKTARLARRARELVDEAAAGGRSLSFAEAVGRAEREEEPQ